MALFFPRGVKLGEIVDPEVLNNEYRAAARVARSCTHWQWGDGLNLNPPGVIVQGQESNDVADETVAYGGSTAAQDHPDIPPTSSRV